MQVRAAALKLGVHENTLRSWEREGIIPAVRLPSGVRRFRVEDVESLREDMYRAVGAQDQALADAAGQAEHTSHSRVVQQA
jgi:DNA-binding transcriptional MerR regulator